MEGWRFCIFQLGWFTITVWLTSGFELLIFVLGYFGSNYKFEKFDPDEYKFKTIIKSFQMICVDEDDKKILGEREGSFWNVDCTTKSMMLFKFHIIVIMMYTMVIWVVLWEVPYRYDRLKKSKAEKQAARKKRKKAARKKLKKKNKANGKDAKNR